MALDAPSIRGRINGSYTCSPPIAIVATLSYGRKMRANRRVLVSRKAKFPLTPRVRWYLVSHMANKQEALDRAFGALSDPTRRAILMRLASGPASVGELAEPFSMAMPTLLQHVRVLEQSRLIATQKTGRVRTCSLEAAALAETEQWLAQQRALWEHRLDRMESYVVALHAAKVKKNAKRKRK
jgi:DNA-binding transcriptional ArsR family regulator